MKLQQSLIFTATLFFFHTATAQDWPQWRGPNRDGVATNIEMPNNWAEQPKLLWSVEVGTGHASPLVVNDQVFIFARLDDDEVLTRLNLTDGKIIWQKKYEADYSVSWAAFSHGKGPKSTPVIYESKIITFGISGILSCHETETGNLLWQKNFEEKYGQASPDYGTAMSPLVHEGICIAHLGGEDEGALTAFDVDTGDKKWQWTGDSPAYASPIIATIQDIEQVITFSKENIIGVDFATGKLLWKIPFTTSYSQNNVTPLLVENDLILSGLDNGVMRVKLTRNGGKWQTQDVWKNPDISAYMSAPLLYDDLILVFSENKKGFYMTLDSETGKELWRSDGRQGENAAMIRSGGFLFSLDNDADFFIAKREGSGFTTLKEYSVADSETWAHPVILGGKILVKDKNKLSLLAIN